MFISKNKSRWPRDALRKVLTVCLAGALSWSPASFAYTSANAEEASSVEDADDRKLQNGSFEKDQTFTATYVQINQSVVPAWYTTAFEEKIEFFKANTGTYIPGVKLTPTEGKIAAELNADEESSLYQTVKTIPSTIYEWGLDHGSRNGTDTMALVIGPKQDYNPSKPSKVGRDQFMQMVDWLVANNMTSLKEEAGLGEMLTLYSKKFGEKGTFVDDAEGKPFSLTPSSIYSEEWKIWIIADSKAGTGVTENPWGHYGSNAKNAEGVETENDSGLSDDSKYYFYTVPSGQTETLFSFVSVGFVSPATTAEKAKTYGNFLDNINFELYHPLSGSSTNHGSAVVGGSDNSTWGADNMGDYEITVDNKLASYLKDGESLKVQAVVKASDVETCNFVGLRYTIQDENGNPVSTFLKAKPSEITEPSGDETVDKQSGKWIKTISDNGDVVYTYYLSGLKTAIDLHFVFIKSPTITYDSNGGKPYVVERTHNTDEAENVYSFKPYIHEESGTYFIDPYTSKAAEGQDQNWKFVGWLRTGDYVEPSSDYVPVVSESDLLPAVHTISCNYSMNGATGSVAAQEFEVWNGDPDIAMVYSYNDAGEITGVSWSGETDSSYRNIHKGMTMIAQWRWRQAFIPQVKFGDTITNSSSGGHVLLSGACVSDENYDSNTTEDGEVAYFATTDEKLTATAVAAEGYSFLGWYDESGNLVTTNTEYSYTEEKEGVHKYFARFTNSVTQTFIRVLKDGDSLAEVYDDNIGTLSRYTYTDAIGSIVSSTATAGSNYRFIGWYDAQGTPVADDKLSADKTSITYKTTKDETFYARFERTYTVRFAAQTKQSDGSFKNDTTGGKVSVASFTGLNGESSVSKAIPADGARFLGWYDTSGNPLSENASYTAGTTPNTNGTTYYARFEVVVTKVTLVKTDPDGNRLEDASYHITLNGSDYSEAAVMIGDGLDVDIAVDGTELRLYPGTYTISETVAPVGYDLSAQTIQIEVGENHKIVSINCGDGWSLAGSVVSLANQLNPRYSVAVNKVDGDSLEPLSGAEFTLYRQADGENGAVDIATVDGASHSAVEVKTKAVQQVGEKCTAQFDDLVAGETYYILETVAPDGYSKSRFATEVTASLSAPDVIGIKINRTEVISENRTAQFTVKNWKLMMVPTGVNDRSDLSGALVMVILGGALCVGMLCFCIKKRRHCTK